MALKIGSEDKKKVAIAGGLGVVVLGLVAYNLIGSFGGSTPPPAPAPAAPVVQSTTPSPASRLFRRSAGTHEAAKVPASMENLDPTLHPELMAQAESLEYTGKGRNIFSMFSTPEIEQPHGPVRPQPVVAQGPVGPPPPPPIDLKFFGFETHQGGGSRKVFLLHGDNVFIASEGDVVDHRYKVVRIAPFSVQVEDIPFSNTQTLPLIQN
jgi:hypothetical protein